VPRAFFYTLAGVNVALAVAGAVFAGRQSIPPAVAAPIVAAFLLQFSFYLVPGFPAARRYVEERLSSGLIAALAVGAAVVPYLVYSLPTGSFHWEGLGRLLVAAGMPVAVFTIWPTRRRGLTWQDAVVLAGIGMVELGGWYRQIYPSPVPGVTIDFLGRIMMIGVAATAFLSLRKLEGSGYQLWASRADWKTGLITAGCFLPVGALLGAAIGFGRYRPLPVQPWLYPALAVGMFLGMYAAVAVFEELLFRGVLQNLAAATLGRPRTAQVLASVVYGLVHLPFRSFPNWRFALLAGVAGWFYGQAYRQRGSVVPAAVAHALVVMVWRLWFTG
jgi:membrane protease YdiL (CAAX protease family)